MTEAEWKLLPVKLLRDSDLRVKFRTPLEDLTDFIRSIPAPRDATETCLKDEVIPAYSTRIKVALYMPNLK